VTRSLGRLSYVARGGKAILTQPYEGVERVLERVAERRDSRRPPWPYDAATACEERIHALIGQPWPCEERQAFDEVWKLAVDDLAARGLRVGRGAYGGWDDGDSMLGRIAWCMARHLRARQILETGVGRGLTTRVLLEALERNGGGRLWSIDLPPLLERQLAEEVGAAVPERLRERWTLLHGSSRRRLPGLLADLGQVDLFLHDSMHTTRNVGFELERVWPALAPGGAALIDDVEKNVATGKFLQARRETASVICRSDDARVLIGCIVKPSPQETVNRDR
jgi:predicted O-methyltransferase YrrM